jgi:hypothetical protein
VISPTATSSPGPRTHRVRTRLSISYSHHRGRFKGHVGSSNKRCRGKRAIKVFFKKPGRDQKVGKTKSTKRGSWKLRYRSPRDGRYYGKVKDKRFTDSSGRRFDCLPDKSPSIKVQ